MTQSLLRLWGWPIALGLLTASGLACALLFEPWGGPWAWFALSVPIAVVTWFGLRQPAN